MTWSEVFFGLLFIVSFTGLVHTLLGRPWWTWLRGDEWLVLLSYPMASAERRRFLRGLMNERKEAAFERKVEAAVPPRPRRLRAPSLRAEWQFSAKFSLGGPPPQTQVPFYPAAPPGVRGEDWHSCDGKRYLNIRNCPVHGPVPDNSARAASATGVPLAQAGTELNAAWAWAGIQLADVRAARSVAVTARDARRAHAEHLERLADERDRRAAESRFPAPLTPVPGVVRGPRHSAQAARRVSEDEL